MTKLRFATSVCWGLGLLLLFSSCGKGDGYVYPSLVTEFVDAQTNVSSTIEKIKTDKGSVYTLSNTIQGKNLTPDSTYRAYCKYEISEENITAAKVYTLKLILSPNPINIRYFTAEIKTDPVAVKSIWRGGNYINIVLSVMVHGDAAHTYHFIDKGFTLNSDGTKTENILLYHNRQNDVEGWTEDVYLSIPLNKYKGVLSEGDRIKFDVNTGTEIKSYYLDY